MYLKWWRNICFQDNLVYRLEGIEAPKPYCICNNINMIIDIITKVRV